MLKRGFLFVNGVFLSLVVTTPIHAERLGYPPEEVATRRKALCERLEHGSLLMFGNTMPALAARDHQDNDFYYLTGNEDLNAVIIRGSNGGRPLSAFATFRPSSSRS